MALIPLDYSGLEAIETAVQKAGGKDISNENLKTILAKETSSMGFTQKVTLVTLVYRDKKTINSFVNHHGSLEKCGITIDNIAEKYRQTYL
jgi:hypothetical protein